MALKDYKPITPGRRQMLIVDREGLSTDGPQKRLLRPRPQRSGRNNLGRVTARCRGGGHKRRYRLIDFRRDKDDVPARVETIEYDPNRSARIALLHYADGEKRYILAPDGLAPGAQLLSGEKAEPENGNHLPLGRIPEGASIHNVELKPGRGGQLVRSAGVAATLLAKESEYAHVLLPSGEVRLIRIQCRATMGKVGNPEHNLESYGKAGRTRWKGRRPHVRGMAMNPCDHPHGGGEGRSKGGNHPQSPSGIPAKGYKTRRRNKYSSQFIVRRRK